MVLYSRASQAPRVSRLRGLLVGLAQAALQPHHKATRCSSLLEMWAGSILGVPAPQVQLAKNSTGKKKNREGTKEIQVTSQTLLLFKPTSLPPFPGDSQNVIPACCEARAAS